MSPRKPRLAVRAIIVHEQRLLLVNAYPVEKGSQLWCAPGGGVETGLNLPGNVRREVFEETGLRVSVGDLALVNEFHDPRTHFHQVEMFFRCQIVAGQIDDAWRDPENVVGRRQYFSPSELDKLHLRPKSLPRVAFAGPNLPVQYDPLEKIVF